MTRKDLNWVFDQCLVKLQNGASLESVLAEYPEWKQELRPVLEAVLAVWESRGSDTVPVAAMTRSRERLQEDAQRRRAVAPRESAFQRWFRSLRMATVPAVLLLVTIGLGLTGLASVQALPGQPLYPVKLAAERFTLSLPASASQRLAREETYDIRRNEEVETLMHQQREQEVYFTGYLSRGEDLAWRVDHMVVEVPADLVESLTSKLGRYVYVHADLMPDGRMVVEWVEDRVYTISGRVQEVDGLRFRIDGIWVDLTEDTAMQGETRVGADVIVSVVRLSDDSLMAVNVRVGGGQTQEYNLMPTEQPGEDDGGILKSTVSSNEDGWVATPEKQDTVSTPEPKDDSQEPRKTEENRDKRREPTPEPTKRGDDEHEKSPDPSKSPKPTENHDD